MIEINGQKSMCALQDLGRRMEAGFERVHACIGIVDAKLTDRIDTVEQKLTDRMDADKLERIRRQDQTTEEPLGKIGELHQPLHQIRLWLSNMHGALEKMDRRITEQGTCFGKLIENQGALLSKGIDNLSPKLPRILGYTPLDKRLV